MKKRNKNGFTLVEILIYLGIIGFVVTGFISYSFDIVGARNKTFVISEVQANIRTALNFISQKVRHSSQILSPVSGATSSTLVLDMPGAEQDVTFDLSDGVLRYTEGLGSPVAVTSNDVDVSDLVFSRFASSTDPGNIRIEITVDYRHDNTNEYTYSKSMRTAVSSRQ